MTSSFSAVSRIGIFRKKKRGRWERDVTRGRCWKGGREDYDEEGELKKVAGGSPQVGGGSEQTNFQGDGRNVKRRSINEQ